jgi:NhaA family Na+:H+ antiporter
LLCCLVNPSGTRFNVGWGIPTVTDIAFSLGVLTLLGNRISHVLKVFLTALAIVDDLGAVLLIVLFYARGVHWLPLVFVLLAICSLIALNRANIRHLAPYIVLGFALWLAMLYSGIHSTVAGVLLALCIPACSKIKVKPFCEEGLAVFHLLQNLEIAPNRHAVMSEERYQSGIQNIETLCEEAQAPLQRLEHTLHPWVTYGIMPLFAFANAGVSFSPVHFAQVWQHPIALGIILGLVVGKPLGITLLSWLSVRLKLAALPDTMGWRHVYGLSCLGGIGFTMSLFISDLAFAGALADTAKIAIMVASLVSGLAGWFILHTTLTGTSVQSVKGLPG